MVQIKVVGTANTKQMQAALASVREEAKLLNAELAKASMTPMGGNPAGYRRTISQMGQMTRAYDSAIASSGAYTVEQIRLGDVVEKNTALLAKQKLAVRDVFGKGAKNMMNQIYREQLAMQNMMARSVKGGITGRGGAAASLYIPTQVDKSWDEFNKRVGMTGYKISTASRSIANFGKQTQWAGRQLTAGLTYPMLAVGAAAGVMAYKVDQQFTRVRKVYNTTADQYSSNVEVQKQATEELNKVREDGAKTAINAAKLYGSSITDTLAVQADLAAAGQKGAQLQSATTAVMRSAMLGEIDYQTATKATIALQQQLHASSSDLADMWAYMNSVENQTSLSMADFATAIPIALGPIRTMGGDLQDLGTLLTGMVSQGISIGKAANAIKSLPQRLSRPSKQVQEEFKMLTGQDIMAINDQHGDNIIDLLTAIYHATEPLEDQARKKVFAGLFGSFQLSNIQAMVQSMGDLENGVNQVTTAQNVGMQGAEAWGQVQRQEIEAFQKSASGQFKIALQTIKASLATAGEPFLIMATSVLKGLNAIIGAFNSLPGIVKKGLMGLLIFGAILGPVIMLAGLFGVLIGNIGLMAGWVLRLVSSFNILNKEEQANAMINSLANKGLNDRATSTQLLTERVQALTNAMIAQTDAWETMNAAQAAAAGRRAASGPYIPGPYAAAANAPVQGPQYPYIPTNYKNPPAAAAYGVAGRGGSSGMYGVARPPTPYTYSGATGGNMYAMADPANSPAALAMAKRKAAIEKAAAQVRERNATRLKEAETARVKTQEKITQSAAAETKIRTKTQSVVGGTGVAMGAMGAAMAVQMATSNKTADNIAKWVTLLAIGVPAAKGLALALGTAGTKAGEIAAKVYAASAAQTAGAASTLRTAGALRAASAGAKGLAAGFGAMMGPVGWIAAAIGTIAYVGYKVYQNDKKITEEKRKQAMAMYDQTNILQDQLQISEKSAKRLNAAPGVNDVSGLPNATDLAAMMKGNDKDYKDLIGSLTTDDNSAAEKSAVVMEKYRQILESTGGSAAKAKLYVTALYQAAGEGALEASQKADKLAQQLGSNFGQEDKKTLWTDQILSTINDAWDDKSLKEQGTKMGQDFADSLAAGGKSNMQGNIMQMSALFNSQLDKEWKSYYAGLDAQTSAEFDKLGITSMQTFKNVQDQWNDDPTKAMKMANDLGITGEALQRLDTLMASFNMSGTKAGAIMSTEKAAAKEVADQLGVSEATMKNINTLADVRNTFEFQLATATKGNAQALYQQRIAQESQIQVVKGLLNGQTEMTDQQRLAVANQILWVTQGKQAKTLAIALGMLSGRFADNTERAASAAGGLATGYKMSEDEIKNIMKSGMSGVEDDIASSISDSFDKRMDAAVDAAQSTWDKKIKALQDKQQNDQDKFDARWERRKNALENYYKNRQKAVDDEIKAEQKAEDIRQKIFEAEQTRIKRQADALNRQIDFQVAVRTGNLDEAAKIQNDAIAANQQNAYEDAASSSGDQSQVRQDALNEQKDFLSEQEDNAQKALEKREDREKKHFDKMQEIQMDALQAQADASMKAYQEDWQGRKDSLSDQLDLFKSYIATNQGDLEDWMKEVGLSYDQFGKDTKKKGEGWSQFFQTSLSKHIRAAGAEVASDKMWETYGRKEALGTLRGMGFQNFKSFKKFIMTGDISGWDYFKKKRNKPEDNNPSVLPGQGRPIPLPGESAHTGGFIGSGLNSRNGVARTTHGLHNSEIMLRAQKGEFLVNREVARQNPDILTYFNKHGVLPPGNSAEYRHGKTEGLGAGGGLGPVGIMGALARGVSKGIVGAMAKSGKAMGMAKANARAASSSSGGAGVTPYTGVIGEPNKIGAHAINWAADQIGIQGWYKLCQKFVRTALGAGGGFASAEEAWGGAKYRHSIGDPTKVPPGVPVYWTDGGFGHVALSTGGGNVISTDYPNSGYVGTGTIAGITSNWHKTLAGWTEDINGKRIFGLPGMSTGGYTQSDGPAIVHKDELVVDPSRTKKLMNLVDTISSNPNYPWQGLFKLGPNGMPMVDWTAADAQVKDANTATAAGADSGKNVKIGTYNVKFSSKNEDTMADLDKLFKLGDVFSLTEFVNSKRALIPWINKQGWGVAGATGSNESVIAYNKAKYNASNVGQTTLNTTLGRSLSGAIGKGGARSVTAAYALLSGNGQKFWQIAAHTIAHIWKDPTRNRAVQQEQFGNLGKLATRLGKSGNPVFVGGDMNNDPRNMGGSRPGGAQGMKYFKPLTDAGLSSNWIKPFMASQSPTMGDRFIDHVFFNSMAKLLNTRTIGGMHSDHNAVLSEFNIPQMRKGGITLSDGIAKLHDEETVLSKDLSSQFKQGVQNFANGGGNVYNNYVTVNGEGKDVRELAVEITRIQERKAARGPQSRSNR